MNNPLYIIIAIAALVAVWFVRGQWDKRKPTTKEVGLKLALKGAGMLAGLQSSAPEDVAAAAAKQAHEAALTAQLKATIEKL